MVETPFKYSIDQVACKPYPEDWSSVPETCMLSSAGWGSGVLSKAPGMLVRANTSDSLRTITLADANDMAILAKPGVPQDLIFRATSFGARASCQSVNHLCEQVPVINCAGFPSDFPPFHGHCSASPATQEGTSQLFIQSSNCAWDASCDHVYPVLESLLGHPGQGDNPPVNAYNFWMQFLWISEGDQPFGISSTSSDAVGSYSRIATMIVNCTLQFYNVTVDYRNGSYSLVHEELSNVGLSDGLAMPSRLGHFSSNLISNIEGRVFTDTSTDSLMAFLQQDLARLSLGSAAVITNISADTLMQGTSNNVIVGRYPLWPVIIFVILIYMHAALGLILFFVTAIPAQRDVHVLTTADERVCVSVLELTQMSTLFPPYHAEASQIATLSVSTDELDMFDEKPDNERVVAGVYSGGNSPPRFGVHRNALSYFSNSVLESKLRVDSGNGYDQMHFSTRTIISVLKTSLDNVYPQK